MSLFTARIASSSDIPLIHTLGKEAFFATYLPFISKEQVAYMFHKMYDTASLLEQINKQKHHFVLVYLGDTPIGFASYQKDVDTHATSKLHKLYILPDIQSKGAGKFLLHFIENLIQSEGQKALLLNVNRYNKAVDFYKHLNYKIVAEDDIDIGNGFFMNDYEMKKNLSNSF